MNKNIVVAGGAGFIGSHLCMRLINEGESVIALDDLSTGNVKNIANLKANKNFRFEKVDATRDSALKFLYNEKIDEIYHLASPASVTYVVEHPVEAATVNSLGSINLLNIARLKKARILFASSSEVYGQPLEHPQKETYWGNSNPIGIRSGYDEGKRFGEALFMAYHREYGVETRIARIHNTYGPNSSPNDSRVIPRFITSALGNKPLEVHGDGTQTRSFCYVSDMVDGLIRLMASEYEKPVNLGTNNELTIIEVARKVIELTDSKSQIKFAKRPQDDPSVRQPDISLAREKLLFKPKVDLETGLKLTIDYFRGVLL